jgi:hypothetical protein
LNDLYRLPDSVFNDDNLHAVLTGFDMVMLRATYAPELQSGMTRDQVSQKLPSILARLNPAGEINSRPLPRTSRQWVREIEDALGGRKSYAQRLSAARSASKIAAALGWQDHRRGFSEYTWGLLLQRQDANAAQTHYANALAAIAQTPGTDQLRALITSQTAAYAIATNAPRVALDQLDSQINSAMNGQNAILLSTLMFLQAEGLDMTDQSTKAQAVRLDSQGWARYGFGSQKAVSSRMNDIAALRPMGRQ